MKKIYIILAVTLFILVLPYLFRNQLYIDIANEYINEFDSDWDTVFVKFPNPKIDISESDLNINKNNPCVIKILKDTTYFIDYNSTGTVTINVSVYSWLAFIDVEVFAGEGSKDFEEYYLFGIFKWFLISKTLTGIA